MKRPDFRSPRLFVEEKLAADTSITLDKKPAHYLRNVLRLKADDTILVFNGKHGEWRAALELDPDNALYLADRGRILLALGDRAEAEVAIRRAEELVPDDPEVQAAVALLNV